MGKRDSDRSPSLNRGKNQSNKLEPEVAVSILILTIYMCKGMGCISSPYPDYTSSLDCPGRCRYRHYSYDYADTNTKEVIVIDLVIFGLDSYSLALALALVVSLSDGEPAFDLEDEVYVGEGEGV